MLDKSQRPNGPKGLNCPLFKKPAAQVCKTCMFWEPARMQDPRDGQIVEQWACAYTWTMRATMDNGYRINQMAAVVEDERNVVSDVMSNVAEAITGVQQTRIGHSNGRMIDQK